MNRLKEQGQGDSITSAFYKNFDTSVLSQPRMTRKRSKESITGGVPYDSLTPMPEFRQQPPPLFGGSDSLFRNTASPNHNFASINKLNS